MDKALFAKPSSMLSRRARKLSSEIVLPDDIDIRVKGAAGFAGIAFDTFSLRVTSRSVFDKVDGDLNSLASFRLKKQKADGAKVRPTFNPIIYAFRDESAFYGSLANLEADGEISVVFIANEAPQSSEVVILVSGEHHKDSLMLSCKSGFESVPLSLSDEYWSECGSGLLRPGQMLCPIKRVSEIGYADFSSIYILVNAVLRYRDNGSIVPEKLGYPCLSSEGRLVSNDGIGVLEKDLYSESLRLLESECYQGDLEMGPYLNFFMRERVGEVLDFIFSLDLRHPIEISYHLGQLTALPKGSVTKSGALSSPLLSKRFRMPRQDLKGYLIRKVHRLAIDISVKMISQDYPHGLRKIKAFILDRMRNGEAAQLVRSIKTGDYSAFNKKVDRLSLVHAGCIVSAGGRLPLIRDFSEVVCERMSIVDFERTPFSEYFNGEIRSVHSDRPADFVVGLKFFSVFELMAIMGISKISDLPPEIRAVGVKFNKPEVISTVWSSALFTIFVPLSDEDVI